MIRLFLTATMALALAACSTTGKTTQETSMKTNTAYAFKTGFDEKAEDRIDSVKSEPRLGFAGFSGSQTRWGAN